MLLLSEYQLNLLDFALEHRHQRVSVAAEAVATSWEQHLIGSRKGELSYLGANQGSSAVQLRLEENRKLGRNQGQAILLLPKLPLLPAKQGCQKMIDWFHGHSYLSLAGNRVPSPLLTLIPARIKTPAKSMQDAKAKKLLHQ